MDGYQVFFSTNFDGRGVAIYLKKDLCGYVTESSSGDIGDIICVKLSLKNNDSLLLVCAYRSPSNSQEQNVLFLDKLSNICCTNFSHLLITGDFNFGSIDWINQASGYSDSHDGTNFMNWVQDHFYFQHVTQATRFRDGQNPSLLDLVFTNEEDMIDDICYSARLGKSDHAVLTFKFDCYIESQDNILLKPNYHYGDYVQINEELKKTDWEGKFENGGTEECWNLFSEIIAETSGRHIPKAKKGDNSKVKEPLWINKGMKKMIKLKRKTWFRYNHCPSRSNKAKFKDARNKVTSMKRKAIWNFEKMIASEIKQKPKSFWRYVNSKTKVKVRLPSLKDENNVTHSDDQSKTEILNTFFSTVFVREDIDNVPEFQRRVFDTVCSEVEISPQIVVKYLKKLNVTKRPGPDGIHPMILRECRTYISEPLSKMFSNSLKEGIVPRNWKEAHIVPILKKGSRVEVNNYRPVSLTAVCCKVMESIVRDSLIKHFVNNNLLSEHRHGFRSGRSTTTQLLEIVEH
ncbi:uncharacterized protein [Antedon mediterranea]|uniref:uncharacterized protein n=1 Tax=Antedon mediterranea TaxID=105859 RepID=UPI003AF4ECCC